MAGETQNLTDEGQYDIKRQVNEYKSVTATYTSLGVDNPQCGKENKSLDKIGKIFYFDRFSVLIQIVPNF